MCKVVVTFSKTKQSSLVFFGAFWIDEEICFENNNGTSFENVVDWTHLESTYISFRGHELLFALKINETYIFEILFIMLYYEGILFLAILKFFHTILTQMASFRLFYFSSFYLNLILKCKNMQYLHTWWPNSIFTLKMMIDF